MSIDKLRFSIGIYLYDPDSYVPYFTMSMFAISLHKFMKSWLNY